MVNSKADIYKNRERRTYNISEEKREQYRQWSAESRHLKQLAQQRKLKAIHPINCPTLNPDTLMPQCSALDLTCLSLFSGGGGLDLGVDRAGFQHLGSYELIPICGNTLKQNKPKWCIHNGPEQGNVATIDWTSYQHKVDLLHGGPPCQPFSVAGGQDGYNDERNMWGEFIRAIHSIQPKVFVAENVLGLMMPKFKGFVQSQILDHLSNYKVYIFELNAADFGVPQMRRRVFFVGFQSDKYAQKFQIPLPTHQYETLKSSQPIQLRLEGIATDLASSLPKTMGVREALGLPAIGFDAIAPTLRSAFTGKRNTISILNSAAGQKAWAKLQIWPNGVQKDRESASAFPTKNNHFRLSVQDCAILQGFPETWQFSGAVYQILGQIGNSVSPPVAYQVALAVRKAMT